MAKPPKQKVDEAAIETIDIDELIPDDENFNLGTEFGNGLIENSLREFGAGRSILLDRNNKIIAGNKTTENAAAAGFKKVRVIETTGDEIIAVKRVDLDLNSKKGRELAFADNATAKNNIAFDFPRLHKFEIPAAKWGVFMPDPDTDLSDFFDADHPDKKPDVGKIVLEFDPMVCEKVLKAFDAARGEGESNEQVVMRLLGVKGKPKK